MATGVERVYPARHRGLARDIVSAGGCLVTEFAPGQDPLPYRFPQRNRVVSGLSLGTLVVEAKLPSGSLLTASAAAQQGREVMTVPHAVGEPGGRGCHQLLRDGAALIETAEDVLAVLGASWLGRLALPSAAAACDNSDTSEAALDDHEQQLLQLLGGSPMALDDLVHDAGLSVSEVLATLGALEVSGHVLRSVRGYTRAV